MSLPDAIARERCFVIHGRRLKLATNVDNEALAAATEGMTGADIEHVQSWACFASCMFGP